MIPVSPGTCSLARCSAGALLPKGEEQDPRHQSHGLGRSIAGVECKSVLAPICGEGPNLCRDRSWGLKIQFSAPGLHHAAAPREFALLPRFVPRELGLQQHAAVETVPILRDLSLDGTNPKGRLPCRLLFTFN